MECVRKQVIRDGVLSSEEMCDYSGLRQNNSSNDHGAKGQEGDLKARDRIVWLKGSVCPEGTAAVGQVVSGPGVGIKHYCPAGVVEQWPTP